MSHVITDCDGGAGNVIVARGVVDDKDYLEFYEKHLSQDVEKFKKYIYSLVDYTAVTQVDISIESIKYIATLSLEASKVNPNPIIAFAADSDLKFGLSRMYEALVSQTDWEVMVFRTKEEAMDWIIARVRDKFGTENLTFGNE